MATLGNATNFGDLSVSRGSTGASTPIRVVFAGGVKNPNYTNIIDFVTIQTDGNATDYGDLTVNRTYGCFKTVMEGCKNRSLVLY